MKFLKWLGLTILAIVVLYLIIPLFLSSSFHVERSINIERPVEIVFQTATDMNMRAKWDPWIEMEPEVEMNVTMLPEIVGSGYTWKGEIIGEGEIEILEFVPNELIKSKIRFIEPQSMESDVIWTFKPTEKGTEITWAFEGGLSYPVEKWYGLFMDKWMGPNFEKGLNNFKTLVEKLPNTIGRTGEIKEINFAGAKAVSIKEKCAMDKLSGKMFDMYTSLMGFLNENDVEIDGSPFAIYHPSDEEGFTILECALPVSNKIKGKDNINFIEIPEGKAIMASHFGHYNTVKTTYKAVLKYVGENNLEINGSPWEIYTTDPTKEADQSKWETQVHVPIK